MGFLKIIFDLQVNFDFSIHTTKFYFIRLANKFRIGKYRKLLQRGFWEGSQDFFWHVSQDYVTCGVRACSVSQVQVS